LIENSALLVALIAAGVLGIVAVFWWRWRERRAQPEY
jgi:heme/copper-type cytochrome/quinol oxidase subunit 2